MIPNFVVALCENIFQEVQEDLQLNNWSKFEKKNFEQEEVVRKENLELKEKELEAAREITPIELEYEHDIKQK